MALPTLFRFWLLTQKAYDERVVIVMDITVGVGVYSLRAGITALIAAWSPSILVSTAFFPDSIFSGPTRPLKEGFARRSDFLE